MTLINSYGITPYDMVAPSDHRDLFIDVDIHKYLENSPNKIIDHTRRKLQSKVTDGVVTYKKYIMKFMMQLNIFIKAHNLQKK